MRKIESTIFLSQVVNAAEVVRLLVVWAQVGRAWIAGIYVSQRGRQGTSTVVTL